MNFIIISRFLQDFLSLFCFYVNIWYNSTRGDTMAYEIKKRDEFINSLKKININQFTEKKSIKDFVPIGLSNLYHLFVSIKDESINDAQFARLVNLITSNYNENVSQLLHNPITDNEINELLEIMKETYLQNYIQRKRCHFNKRRTKRTRGIKINCSQALSFFVFTINRKSC